MASKTKQPQYLCACLRKRLPPKRLASWSVSARLCALPFLAALSWDHGTRQEMRPSIKKMAAPLSHIFFGKAYSAALPTQATRWRSRITNGLGSLSQVPGSLLAYMALPPIVESPSWDSSVSDSSVPSPYPHPALQGSLGTSSFPESWGRRELAGPGCIHLSEHLSLGIKYGLGPFK